MHTIQGPGASFSAKIITEPRTVSCVYMQYTVSALADPTAPTLDVIDAINSKHVGRTIDGGD